MSTTNLEEAATVAAEFVSSLENLPSEVQHLLAEIRHKDNRSQELQQEINKESAKYIRHSIRNASSANPAQPLPSKDLAIPQAVKAHYVEIDRLSSEKEALAERIVQLINRARARLDHDLNKVLVLQGELEPSPPQGALGLYGTGISGIGTRTPISGLNESLRSAFSNAPETPIASISSAGVVAPPPQKRRKTTASGATVPSIKISSPAPPSLSAISAASAGGGGPGVIGVGAGGAGVGSRQASRLSQQVHPPARSGRSQQQQSQKAGAATMAAAAAASVTTDMDEDAEGEEDLEENGEEGGDVEDKELYCFCQKLSYGEMIACDNPDCKYQWFHLPCVNLKPPLPEQWYCSECVRILGVPQTTPAPSVGETGRPRKGRKK